ncbi:MAG: ABC transporter substrate-binding protein [Pseudomonadota bacterium]
MAGWRVALAGVLWLSGALALAQDRVCPDGADIDASRIAVAGGSITEVIYLLGEDARLVAADRTSNYPEAALALPSIGYVRALSAEGVLSVDPTLVLGEHDMGPPEVVEQLQRTKVDVLKFPETFTAQGVIDKVNCVASLLRLRDEQVAQATLALQAEAAALKQVQPDSSLKVALLLGLREGTPVAAGGDTSGNGLLAMAGLTNVFEDLSGWKPVSLEAMASAGPDVLVVPARGVEQAGGVDALLDHPALRLTPVAKTRRVIAMDGMRMLGFGPRTIGAATELAQRTGTLPDDAGPSEPAAQ